MKQEHVKQLKQEIQPASNDGSISTDGIGRKYGKIDMNGLVFIYHLDISSITNDVIDLVFFLLCIQFNRSMAYKKSSLPQMIEA